MREKTNSITHLVKIVAEEVFEEKIDHELSPMRLRAVCKAVCKEVIGDCAKEIVSETLAGMTPEPLGPGKRTGDFWGANEDKYLRLMFREFCNYTAYKMKRSTGAIEARVGQKLV